MSCRLLTTAEALFLTFRCCAEDAALPAVVRDALAPFVCERAGGVAQGTRKVRTSSLNVLFGNNRT